MMTAAIEASTASSSTGHAPMAEMTVTISEPRPLKIAGSTVSRINAPITGSRLTASAAIRSGQQLEMSSATCARIPTQSTACKHSMILLPTASQSTWPRIVLMACSTSNASVLNAENSPGQSIAAIIVTILCPRSSQFVPCTAAISAFSRPMAKPLTPSPASSHGILAMAELMHIAMPLPKSVQPL